MNKADFTIWLEFEEVGLNNFDIENEFANIHVTLSDGHRYGISVWTFKFFETTIKQNQENGKCLDGLYQIPPDLFVKEMTRECIEKTIADLLSKGTWK